MVKHTYESFNSSFNSDIEVFPSEYFYPEVAYWNKEPMEQACRRRRHDDAAREACDWLSKFPGASSPTTRTRRTTGSARGVETPSWTSSVLSETSSRRPQCVPTSRPLALSSWP